MKITTVQGFIDNEMGLSIWCQHCRKGAMLNMQKVKAVFGGDLSLSGPLPFCCPHCEGPVSISVHGSGSLRVTGRAGLAQHLDRAKR